MNAVRLLLAMLVMLLASAGLGGAAHAHLTPNSEVALSVAGDRIEADIIVPQGEYAFATGNQVADTAAARETARRYLAERIRVTGTDGRPWTVAIQQPEFVQIAGPPDLHARATFTPSPGQDPDRFDLDWRVVVDDLPSHFALVVLDRPGQEREIVGAIRAGTGPLAVVTTQGPLAVLQSAIVLGAEHIATGYDHLLFLLALLLPAPLIARQGHWRNSRPARATFVKLAKITIAFTIGHSLTLVGATLGGWQLPTAPVEIAIAVSVFVSAIHAIRPIFPGREPLVAGAFGLVHGLAFATLVHDAGVGLASSAIGLLGFNLGIELVQLAVVCIVMPVLVVLSRRPRYMFVRVAGGIACALAAAVWIATRTVDAIPLGSASPTVLAAIGTIGLAALTAFIASRTSNRANAPATTESA